MDQILNEKEVKELLRKSLIYNINNHSEFKYLEDLCYYNGVTFNKKIINYCLDRYIGLRKQNQPQFKSKYASMWIISWKIMYDEYI